MQVVTFLGWAMNTIKPPNLNDDVALLRKRDEDPHPKDVRHRQPNMWETTTHTSHVWLAEGAWDRSTAGIAYTEQSHTTLIPVWAVVILIYLVGAILTRSGYCAVLETKRPVQNSAVQWITTDTLKSDEHDTVFPVNKQLVRCYCVQNHSMCSFQLVIQQTVLTQNVFWDVTPCGPRKSRRFGGTYRLHL
jgi:hypothetical protein